MALDGLLGLLAMVAWSALVEASFIGVAVRQVVLNAVSSFDALLIIQAP